MPFVCERCLGRFDNAGRPLHPVNESDLPLLDYFAAHILNGLMAIPANLEIKREEFPDLCAQVWALAQTMVDTRPHPAWAPPPPPPDLDPTGKRGR